MCNVLVLIHHIGVSPRLLLEMKALHEAGYGVHVVAWNRSTTPSAPPLDIHGVHWEQIVLPAPRASLRLLWYLPALYRAYARQAASAEPDVIHCTHLFLLPIALWLGRRHQAKVVYDAYEFIALDIPYVYRLGMFSKVVSALVQTVENWLVRRTGAVLTVSTRNDVLAQRYRHYTPIVQVLLNVPEAQGGGGGSRVATQINDEPDQDYVLVYMGGVQRNKGILVALEALSQVLVEFPQTTLRIIGNFKDSKDLILECIDRLELNNHVQLVGGVPYASVPSLLSAGHIGLALYQPEGHFPLAGFGGPRKIFDYMQAGLPIIAPQFGEIGQLVKQVECGLLVDTTDPRIVAQAIRNLLSSTDLRTRLGNAGRAAVEGVYNWQVEKQKLLHVYRALCLGDSPSVVFSTDSEQTVK